MDSGTCVCVRFRPPNSRESGQRCVRIAGERDIVFQGGGGGGGAAAAADAGSTSFTFHKVFGEDATQADVFADCRRIVDGVLAGYNGTIMAYGQTGSGKTHTLIGDIAHPELRGVVPRAVAALGEGIAADASGAEYEVRLTVVEIYCERVRDLLDPLGRDNLAIKQRRHAGGGGGDGSGAGGGGGTYVEGATEVCVGDEAQLVGAMEAGLAQRAVTATHMNAASSRSHCIVTVSVQKTCPDGTTTHGKLRMVDLAGSERQDKTGATGQTLAEGAQINRSLSALANVVAALTDAGTGGGGGSTGGGTGGGNSGGPKAAPPHHHVPYRDSKLTRLLQDSLGGTALTLLVVNCSPCADNAAETLSALRFGGRAIGIRNTAVVNRRVGPEALQKQLAAAAARVAALERELAELRLAAAGAGMGAGAGSAGVQDSNGGGSGGSNGGGEGCKLEHAPGPSQPSSCGPDGDAYAWARGAGVALALLLYFGLEDWARSHRGRAFFVGL